MSQCLPSSLFVFKWRTEAIEPFVIRVPVGNDHFHEIHYSSATLTLASP